MPRSMRCTTSIRRCRSHPPPPRRVDHGYGLEPSAARSQKRWRSTPASSPWLVQHELPGTRSVRRLRCAHCANDHRFLGAADSIAAAGQPVRATAPRLAPRPFPRRGLPGVAGGDRSVGRMGRSMMGDTHIRVITPARDMPSVSPTSTHNFRAYRSHAVSLLITLAAVVLAALGVWAAWHAYMASTWTRDGAVRAYVVTI